MPWMTALYINIQAKAEARERGNRKIIRIIDVVIISGVISPIDGDKRLGIIEMIALGTATIEIMAANLQKLFL